MTNTQRESSFRCGKPDFNLDRNPRRRFKRSRPLLAMMIAIALAEGGLLMQAPRAHADSVAYLVNVTVRPGYNFPNAADALDYGYTICDRVGGGGGYPKLIADVEKDFNTSDEFQASYLITQAVNELCPAQTWQLRNTAAHYRPLA